MKKIFTFILVLIMILSVGITTFADTPQLPEGNSFLGGKWVKYLGEVSVSEEEVDGVKVYSATNFKKSFHTPAINLYPSIKKMMGDNDEITVWIVFDIKNISGDEEEVGFGMKLRAGGLGSGMKNEDDFLNNYSDADTFEFNSGNVYASLAGKNKYNFDNEWTRIEISKTFTSYDINDEFWTSWNLCFDYTDEFDSVGGIQLRNMGIYLEDQYEPVNTEEDGKGEDTSKLPSQTPKPAIIYRPYGYDKYTATFTEVVDSEKSKPQKTEGTDQPNSTENPANTTEENDNTVIIIIAVVAVVVILGAVATIIIVNKKKNSKKEEE